LIRGPLRTLEGDSWPLVKENLYKIHLEALRKNGLKTCDIALMGKRSNATFKEETPVCFSIERKNSGPLSG
jgi:hypothetical protein